MNSIRKISIVLGLLLPVFCSIEAMDLVIDYSSEESVEEHQELREASFLRAVHKASLSKILRECLGTWNSGGSKTFEALLQDNLWLVDYVADDGLTIAEFIITLCDAEFKNRSTSYYSWDWLPSVSIQESLKLIVRLIKTNKIPFNRGAMKFEAIKVGATTTSTAFNKMQYLIAFGNYGRESTSKLCEKLNVEINSNCSYYDNYPTFSRCPSNDNRALLVQELEGEKLSEEKLLPIKKAHLVVTFFSYIESLEAQKIVQLLKEEPWLGYSNKPYSDKQLKNLCDYELTQYTQSPFLFLNQQSKKNALSTQVKQAAAFLLIEGPSLSLNEYDTMLYRDFKELVDDYLKNEELFKETVNDYWNNISLVPTLRNVYASDKLMELRKAIWTSNFRDLLDANEWLLGMQGPDGYTIGEYIIKEYINLFTETEAYNKTKSMFLPIRSYENNDKSEYLDSAFSIVLGKCQNGSDILHKIDKCLIVDFYDDLFCQKHFKRDYYYSYCGMLSLSSSEKPDRYYQESCLHSRRSYAWGPRERLKNIDTHVDIYEKFKHIEHQDAELNRAIIAWRLFDLIQRGWFEDAYDLVDEYPWLARSVKPDCSQIYNLRVTTIAEIKEDVLAPYAITPLAALVETFKNEQLVCDKEWGKKLCARLLAHGVDCTVQNKSCNTPYLLQNNLCVGLNDLVVSYCNDSKAFCDRYNPRPVEPEVEVNELIPEENQPPKVHSEDDEQSDEDEQPRIEQTSYVGPFLKVAAVGVGMFLGRYYAKRKYSQEQARIQEEKNAREKKSNTDDKDAHVETTLDTEKGDGSENSAPFEII